MKAKIIKINANAISVEGLISTKIGNLVRMGPERIYLIYPDLHV